MKHLFVVVWLLLSLPTLAATTALYGELIHTPLSAHIDASTSPIPTMYSTAPGSLILTGVTTNRVYHTASILNETGSRISVVLHTSRTVPPSSTAPNKIYVPSNFFLLYDNFPMYDAVYVQSETGMPVTTGNLEVQFY